VAGSVGRSPADETTLRGVARLAVLLAALAALAAAVPQTGTLKITVAVAADGNSRPVARHALLVSDDPVTRAPQRFVTKGDGIVEVHLRPGRYLVEFDDPFIFEGKAYQ
jgi:hypothetical protein